MFKGASAAAAAAIRRSAVRATLASSARNTQPWRFVLRGNTLEIHADWDRRLRALDRRGEQVIMSCGAATFNARVSLAASGYAARVDRYPDPSVPDLVARLTVTDGTPPLIGALDAVIERRRTNRQPFVDDSVPDRLVDLLVQVAADEGSELVAVRRSEHRLAIAGLDAEADACEQLDHGCRADLRASRAGEPWRPSGVPGVAGRRTGLSDAGLDDCTAGTPAAAVRALPGRCVLVLGCAEQTPMCWLRTGEALERVLLEITRHGYAASPFVQVLEITSTGARLREQVGLAMYPQMVLQVGRSAETVAPRRRRLVDVLEEIAG